MIICYLFFTGIKVDHTQSNETYLHYRVHTSKLDQRVRRCVHLLSYCNLHVKLQQVDMIAQIVMHHCGGLIDVLQT